MLVEAPPETGLPFPPLADRSTFKLQLLSEIYRVLGQSIDHSMDAQLDQSFQKQIFQRCLSLQSSLGYIGEDFSRSLPGLVAWTSLGTRYCTMLFAMAYSKNPNIKPPPGMPDQETKNPGKSGLYSDGAFKISDFYQRLYISCWALRNGS